MTDPDPKVRYLDWVMPMALEAIIDSGQATPEQIAEYNARPQRFVTRRTRLWWWRRHARIRMRNAIHGLLFGSCDACDWRL